MKFKVIIYKQPSIRRISILDIGDVIIYTSDELNLMVRNKLFAINYKNNQWMGDGRVFCYKNKYESSI
jgi:hypothetical protein